MKTPESFPFLIDEIFGGLEAASRIAIELDPRILTNPVKMSNAFLVKSVNRQTSAWRYLHFLKDLRAETMDKLREFLPQIAPADYEAFFQQLQRRSKQCLKSVIITKPTGMETSLVENVTWSPENVFLMCNGEEVEHTLASCRGMRQTRRHAWIYYVIMKKLDERINCIAAASFIVSIQNTGIPNKELKPKFKISLTVAHLGALLRVICDRNIIVNPNIAELCRRIAPSFYTDRQENISPKSLRNSYDEPNVEILTQILQELTVWERYIKKFIERKRR